MATLARLHAEMAALSSNISEGGTTNPDVNRITILRPGIGARSLATLLRASNSSQTPSELSACERLGMATPGGMLVEAISGADEALGEIGENCTPATTLFKRFASEVKFCAT